MKKSASIKKYFNSRLAFKSGSALFIFFFVFFSIVAPLVAQLGSVLFIFLSCMAAHLFQSSQPQEVPQLPEKVPAICAPADPLQENITLPVKTFPAALAEDPQIYVAEIINGDPAKHPPGYWHPPCFNLRIPNAPVRAGPVVILS